LLEKLWQHRLPSLTWKILIYLGAPVLVKDERHYDKFDRAIKVYWRASSIWRVAAIADSEDGCGAEFEKHRAIEEKAKMSLGPGRMMRKHSKTRWRAKERHAAVKMDWHRVALAPLVRMATIRRLRIGRKQAATVSRGKKCGKNAKFKSWMTRYWVFATSKWRCAGFCENLARPGAART